MSVLILCCRWKWSVHHLIYSIEPSLVWGNLSFHFQIYVQADPDLFRFLFPLNGLFNSQRKRTNDGLCNEFTVFHTFKMNWLCSPVWSFKQLHPLILVIMTLENFNISSCFMFPWNKRPREVAWIYIWDRRLQWNNLLIYHLIRSLSQAKSYQFEVGSSRRMWCNV